MPLPVVFRADVADDEELRLIGDPTGKRVLELGISDGTISVALAERGARAVAVDPDQERISAARAIAEGAGVRVEFHLGDIADLGFATSASIDLAVAAGTLQGDVPRLLRQVHRVLKPDGPLLVAMAHPAAEMLDGDDVRRHYGASPARSIGDLFTALQRAHFRVDALHELFPRADASAKVPVVIVLRARKQGV